MWGQSILTVLYLFVAIAHGAPYNSADSSDDNGVVYVLNMYAVKQTSTKAVAKILDGNTMKSPENFQSIGSMIYQDNESDEVLSMKDIAFYMEEMGFGVEKMNEGDEVKVIELKFDGSMEDFYEFENFVELAKTLQTEGIILTMSEENGSPVIQVEFDESIKSIEDQPFTLEELGKVIEAEGLPVDYVKGPNGQIKAVRITFIEDEDEEHDAKNASSNEGKSEKKNEDKFEDKNEKKMEKTDDKQRERKNDLDNQYFPLDFTTKSEIFNKLRRRRSAPCPECKAASIIKSYIQNHDSH